MKFVGRESSTGEKSPNILSEVVSSISQSASLMLPWMSANNRENYRELRNSEYLKTPVSLMFTDLPL